MKKIPRIASIQKILILGSGAIKIGKAGECDYSGAQAIKAVKEENIEVVLVNPNVATIQTDEKFVGDKAYFLPITPEFVEKVIKKERPDGVLLGFGGQTALNCGIELAERGILAKYNVKVLGTSVEAIERADNRNLFRETMLTAGIPILKRNKANTLEEAVQAAKEIARALAGGTRIPESGDSILISVGGEKEKAVDIAKKIVNNGYRIYATEHTAKVNE